MNPEIIVAIIGAVASIVTAFVQREKESKRAKRTPQPASPAPRPSLVFLATLGVGLAITSTAVALFWRPASEEAVSGIFNQRLPVGTVVASILPPREFATLAGDSGSFDPIKSIWMPADGRPVQGSAYTKVLGRGRVPDLRSIFLRGLNVFDESEPLRDKTQQDPDPARKPGDYQPDAFARHSHRYGDTTNFGSGSEKAYDARPRNLGYKTEETGGDETRPKNSAVFYYIKIN